MLISILGIFLTLFLIVGIHEFGHFFAARMLGIKVLRFSIGFGKSLWSRSDKKGTEYVLAAIPLGGYVKMLDESEGDVAIEELHLAFNQQPFYKKFIVVIAGPLSNLIFAFTLYWILFVVGFVSIAPVIGKVVPESIAASAGLKPQEEIISVDNKSTASWMSVAIRVLAHTGDTDQLKLQTARATNKQNTRSYTLDLTHWHMDDLKPDPLTSLGLIPFQPEIPLVIATILPESPAVKSNLKVGDKITALDNKPIKTWTDLLTEIDKRPAEKLSLTINRKGQIQTIYLTTDFKRDMFFQKHGFIGISPQFSWPENFIRKNKYGPVEALSHAWQNTYDFTYLNFMVIGKLLTGKVSLQSLGGPISIFENAGSALNLGIVPFMSFLAFLSISIGVINVFPLPGLDGGHILFQVIEAIKGRPISPKYMAFFYRIGIIVLLLLVVQAVVNDLLRL
ncbi:MAG: RIP metalloprotease RseP [Gammaproteobacteria bacterium]